MKCGMCGLPVPSDEEIARWVAGDIGGIGDTTACWSNAARLTADEEAAAKRSDGAFLLARIESLRAMARSYWCESVILLRSVEKQSTTVAPR